MTPTDPTPLGDARCPHCSFDPTSLSDYCDKHRPSPDAGSAAPRADVKPRHLIWGMSCPFNKQGVPVVGSFGSCIRNVVIIPAETWTALCKEHPTLAATEFEVGIYGD